MFEPLDDAALVEAVGEWSRAENAAAARKLAAMAELFCRRTGLETAEERDCWWVDPTAAVGAEIAAAANISQGLAVAQTHRGVALRDRIPRVAELFAAGQITDLLVRAIVWRTALIKDEALMAEVDTALAAHITRWGSVSVKKTEQRIDAIVEEIDPGAIRQSRAGWCTRDVEFGSPSDEPGFTSVWARLYAGDAATLETRVHEMANSVCDGDPRSAAERRADSFGALGAGAELACGCGRGDCSATTGRPTKNMVVHLIVDSAAPASPGFAMGAGVVPTALLAEMTKGAPVREVRHPGECPPEPRRTPSRALADFVRCRDLTCRWPGCDKSADVCDLDHTVPYPHGPTHASNLKCLCRFHHMLKTFWCGVGGWRDDQSPDGTVTFTAPTGHTYATRPGSAGVLPTLCRPTGSLPASGSRPVVDAADGRGVKMPKRTRTRAQETAARINRERCLNDDAVAERNQPPPF